ncbi:hypothetical protein ADL12_44735 [Streptomyces regalis]|uniref:Uncharacterized protein n=1 Tax=Streptomyces regalis TaxID=68262 RepID=A0A101J752_9ACTN|nr:hypothetical protein ADL12_44735 [Streptomyces regalis]
MGMAAVGLFTGMAPGFAGHLAGFGTFLLTGASATSSTPASTATSGGETSRSWEDDRRRK